MAIQLHILTGSAVPIYRQIVEQVCRAAADGAISQGEQLPSVRMLAEQLLVNPNTVARAYGELIRDGILAGQQGKGVFLAQRRAVYSDEERRRRLETAMEALLGEAVVLGFTAGEVREAMERKMKALPGGDGNASAAAPQPRSGDIV